MNPSEQRGMTLALAQSEGAQSAIDTMIEAVNIFAAECVPDVGPARTAFEAWGIPYDQGGPIHQMFSSTPSLKVALPHGWSFSRRGGGGHHELLDATGASRLRWHIHGWDPISLTINQRFLVKQVDISPTEAVVQVIDGVTVIHTIPVLFPHARINEPLNGRPYYRNGWDEDGWTKEMRLAHFNLADRMYEDGLAWLDKNRPGHRDSIRSWLL